MIGHTAGDTPPTFYNRREMPAEWPALLDQASTLVNGIDTASGHQDSLVAISAMHDTVGRLDGERLDVNRLYGIGVVLCDLAQRMIVPATYESLVERGARLQYEDAKYFDPAAPSMRVGRIGSFTGDGPFAEVTSEVVSGLPADTHLLAETLAVAELGRRFYKQERPGNGLLYEQAGGRSRLARSISKNVLPGAAFVLRRAISAQAAVPVRRETTIAQILDPKNVGIVAQNVRKVAVNCAQLRIDEIQQLTAGEEHPSLSAALVINEQRELEFDRDYLRTDPGPLVEGPVGFPLHTARLECPALQVGMIPLTMRYLAEIVVSADARLAERYEGMRNPPTPTVLPRRQRTIR